MQADDVGVIDFLKNDDLGLQAVLQFGVQSRGSDLFDGDFGAVDAVARVPHRGERASPNLLPHHIIPHHVVAPLRHRELKGASKHGLNSAERQKSKLKDEQEKGKRLWLFFALFPSPFGFFFALFSLSCVDGTRDEVDQRL